MTDTKSPAVVLETRELWSVDFREGDDFPWKEIGVPREDLGAALRTYDFGVEKHPEVEHRMVRTDVLRQQVDPEMLRKRLEEEAAEKATAVLPSEETAL